MIDKPTSAAAIVTDSLRNVVANLGTGRDKASATEFVFDPMLDQQLIEAYRGSWLPRAIVDIPAEDSCRKWRQWKAEAPQIEAIERLEKKLGLSRQIEACYKMARLMGRAYLYISTNEVDPSKPLRTDRVREIRGLPMLTKLDLKPEAMVRDIDSPYYGKAEYYKLNRRDGQAEVRIHASRLVVLEGNSVPSSYGVAGYQDSPLSGVYGDDWCDSVLQSVMDAVKAHDSMLANIVSLIFEAKINVYKFDGFSDQLMRDKGAAIQSRLSLQTVMKGINGDVVIDAKDDFQQRNASFGGLDALLDRAGYIVCGAAEIPYTRVFGRSAAGLSGQGDGDERVYYDRINHIQTNNIEPAMALLDECIIQIALGSRPPEIWFEWRPLRQVSEQERATIFKTTADAARALAGTQAGELIPIEALSDSLVNELVEQGVLPGLDTAIKEYGNLAELAAEIDGGEDAGVSSVTDAKPRTLYVKRNVLNGSDIIRWAKAQGFSETLDAKDLHVTIAYSQELVDWFKVGTSWQSKIEIEAGGPRQIEEFGEAKVLLISCPDLVWRHNEIREAGASWDHPEYQPHITIGYGSIPDGIEAYQGPIILGPEVFEDVDNDWNAT